MLALAINSSYSLELLSFVLFLGISYWNFCLLWQMTGDKNLTQWHLSTALGQCKTFVSFNSTFQADNPDVTAIIDSTCPNNCSNRGECERGTLSFIYFREVTYMYISPNMLTEFFLKEHARVNTDMEEVIAPLTFYLRQQYQGYQTMDFVTSQTRNAMILPFMDTTL